MQPPEEAPPPLARIFLALMLDPRLGANVLGPVREALGQAPGPDLRLYRSDDLHITLAFIGLVRRERIARLTEALDGARPRAGSLDLGLGVTGGFPGKSRPRVLWVALEERRPGALSELSELRAQLVDLCRAKGFSVDPRPFVPHLTVARLRGGARPPPGFWDVDVDKAWKPGELALVESFGGTGQSAFRVLRSWPLGES